MYTTYILYSDSLSKFYIGFTSNMEERIIRHNQKSKGFTGTNNDWKIVYSETFIEKSENFSFLELVLTPEIYFPILMFIVLFKDTLFFIGFI